MIETLTCSNCGQTIKSDKTNGFNDSKAVTCNSCKQKSSLGQWRLWAHQLSDEVPTQSITKPQPPPLSSPQSTRANHNAETIVVQPLNTYSTIALWIAAAGLLLTCLSPFFKWISVGAGGVTGLAGDGKILFAITVVAVVAFITAITKKNLMLPLLVPVQAWGMIVSFWMGALLWKLSSIVNETNVKDNLFAAMLSTMLVSPGVGLYIGLFGGISIAGALGYVTATQFSEKQKVTIFPAIQALALCIGIGTAIFLGPSEFRQSEGSTDPKLFGFGANEPKEEAVIAAELKKSFTLGNLQITPDGFELLTLLEKPLFGEMQPRQTKSFVFTFSAKNISDGEVFAPFTTLKVTDNFGNVCPNPTAHAAFTSSVTIESNEMLKKLWPGKSARVMVAFDPQIQKAKEYTCNLITQSSNREDYKKWQINFSPHGKGQD